MRHVAEIIQLTEALRKARSVVIVGGGYIGLEMAETLLKMGKSVSIVESGRWVLGRMLDEDVGKLVNNYVVSQGAQLRLGETVKRVVGGRGPRASRLHKALWRGTWWCCLRECGQM